MFEIGMVLDNVPIIGFVHKLTDRQTDSRICGPLTDIFVHIIYMYEYLKEVYLTKFIFSDCLLENKAFMPHFKRILYGVKRYDLPPSDEFPNSNP